MQKLKICFFLIAVLTTSRLSATVDYLAVNHFTKQLYWAETDHPPGLIGWNTIPEGKYKSYTHEYFNQGYSFTKNPFLIEEVLLSVVLLLLLLIMMRKRIRRLARTMKGKKQID